MVTLQIGTYRVGSIHYTGEILADVHNDRRLRGKRQHRIKTGDTIGLSGWDVQMLTDVAEGRGLIQPTRA